MASSDPHSHHLAASLAQHLLSQNAPRAAARVSGHELTQPELRAYAVPPECVTLVDTAASAARFSGVLHELLHAPATVGVDLEWRPDTLHAVHRPSLLQLAISTHVWLVDLDAAASCTPALLDAVAALLASSEHRILGFGLQVDLDRLQSVCHREDAPLIARGVVDLRDACLCGTALSSEAGLAAQLRAWTGKSLDKAMQCSDWAARPLSATQIAYAAADAMSLVELDRAIGSWSGGEPDEPRDDPRRECTLVARCVSERTGRFRAPANANEAASADEDEDEAEREARRQAGDEGLRLVRAAIASLPCAHAADCWLADSSAADGATAAEGAAEGPTEINALCFTAGDRELGQVLVLVPALAPKVDLRWLSLALNCPKRKLRLASDEECVGDFGAVPGRVPPLPLRAGTRVLCDPRLCDAAEIWGSSCDPRQRIFIRKPRLTLPALAAAAGAATAGVARSTARGDSHPTIEGGAAAAGMLGASTFEWLPSSERWHPQLDDALDVLRTKGRRGASLIVDPTLSVLARKLRMLGIDCLVAGEVLRADTPTRMPLDIPRMHREVLRESQPPREGEGTPCEGEGEGGRGEVASRGGAARKSVRSPVGLLRVCIEGGAVAAHHRLAALEGRLLITTARHVKQPAPCASYRLLATSDASRQLAEVLTVLQLRDAAERKDDASRCGICNGDAWQRLQPSDVQGTEVPPSVLKKQAFFYRCGVCSQIFWPRGDRPRHTRHGCTGGARRAAHATAGTDRVACTPAEWRPSSQLVMALGAKSKSGGQMLLEARGLHAALRAQLEGPRAAVLVGAVYHY